MNDWARMTLMDAYDAVRKGREARVDRGVYITLSSVRSADVRVEPGVYFKDKYYLTFDVVQCQFDSFAELEDFSSRLGLAVQAEREARDEREREAERAKDEAQGEAG